MKKVLLTGASGFIGTNLVPFLISQNYDVATIDRSRNLNFKNVKQYLGDICDYSFMKKTILDFKPNKVYHLAAHKNRSSNINDLSPSLKINLIGTLNLYEVLTKVSSLESIIALGTTDEYGMQNCSFTESLIEKPISSYGFSKLCGTKLAQFFNRSFNLPVVIIRPTIAYGPHQANDMFIPSLINTLIANKNFKMTEGNQLRDFIYISDLIDAMFSVGEIQNHYGEVFNIGSGESLKLREVANTIARDLNKEHLLNIGSIPYRKNEVMKYETCIDKINNTLGWIPKVSFKEGIKLTVEHYKVNG